MRRMVFAIVLLTTWVVPGVATAGGGSLALCRAVGEGQEMVMRDDCFEGTGHFAAAGVELVVVNGGAASHSYTAASEAFDTGLLAPGETASLVVEEPGIYRVWCTLHGTEDGHGMAGLLVVGEPAPEAVASGSLTADLRRAIERQSAELVAELESQRAPIEELNERTIELSRYLRSPSSGEPAAAPGVVAAAAAPASPAAPAQVVVVPQDRTMAAVAGAAALAALIALAGTALLARRSRSIGGD